jgi:hypothetical protein
LQGLIALKKKTTLLIWRLTGENFRGINAVRVLSEENKYTIDKVIKAGYDKRLSAFEILIPALIKCFGQNVHGNDTLYNKLYEAISIFRSWDFRCGENSIATTLAVEWGQKILPAIFRTKIVEDEEADQVDKAKYFAANAKPEELLQPLVATINDLKNKYGRWQIEWGEINRFQRISSDIDNKFDDSKVSIPVGFVSSTWGMLPSYTSPQFSRHQKKDME